MAPRKDRIQVRPAEDLSPQRFRPQASPDGAVVTPQARIIDTYVQPASTLDHNAGSKTAQLAQALSGLAPTLARFSGMLQQRENTAKTKEGHETALKLRVKGESYKSAVDKGLIRESDNPFFVAGVQEQMGATVAADFMKDLNDHLVNFPELSETTDTKQYDKIVSEFRATWVNENVGEKDQYYKTGFAARLEPHLAEARLKFGSEAAGRLEEFSVQANYRDTKDVGRDLVSKLAPEEWVGQMNQRLTDLRAQGRNVTMLARSTTEAFMDLAKEGDTDYGLEIAGALQKLTIDGKPILDYLSTDKKLMDGVRTLGDDILARDVNRQNLKDAKEKTERADKVESAQSAIAAALLLGNQKGARDIVRDMAALVPGSDGPLTATLDRLESMDDDPQAAKRVSRDIWKAGSKVTIETVFSDPSLGPKDVAFLVNQVQERDAKAERALDRAEAAADRAERRADRAARNREEVFSNPWFKLELANIRSAKAYQEDPMNPSDPSAQSDLGERVATAESALSALWIDYMSNPKDKGGGKNATDQERLVWLRSAVKNLTEQSMETAKEANALNVKKATKAVLTRADIVARQKNQVTDSAAAALEKAGIKPNDVEGIRKFYRDQALLIAKEQKQ